MTSERPYSVNLWGSDPDADNDDCHTGTDFATLEEARAVYLNPWSVFNRKRLDAATAVFEIEGPDVYETRENPEYVVPERDTFDEDWAREIAMQAGMAFGVDGYNDTYGW